MAGRSESDYREVVFEREGKEALHGFMRVDRGMVIVSGPARSGSLGLAASNLMRIAR
jgi:type II secretory ATPase GspE/PulE/Tfp pilus assembly ATPase PilB-like protein